MKFFALAALVATTQAATAAGSVADGSACTADADCTTATSSCCPDYQSDGTAPSPATSSCSAAVTTDQTSGKYHKAADCKGRTAAGAASLAATAAAAATALYAMC